MKSNHRSGRGGAALIEQVHEALRASAVAENSEEAREILNDLFLAHDDVNNLEITRHLIIELCVSVFHGLSTPSPSEPSVSPYQRQSKLGTLPLPPSSSADDLALYSYDQYSDSDDSRYNEERDSPAHDQDKSPLPSYQTTEEQWVKVLSPDIPQHNPDQQITCEDLFHALATNISSVILPKVPLISSRPSSRSSSGTPSVVTTSPSVPSSHALVPSLESPPPHSLNSSDRSSPTEDYQDLLHDFDQEEQEGSEPVAEDDDISSVETIDAVHDQSHPSRHKDQATPSTPPTVRSTKPPHTKAKSGRKVLHLRGPSRLRSLIENAVQTVIQECEFENSATPQKHTPASASHTRVVERAHLRLTNPILKRITRSLSIELSLELSANSFFASDHHHHNPSSTDRLQQLPSPAARDLSSLLWPAISGFVGTEATSEMIGVFVDLIEADVIDKKIFPDLYIHQIEETEEQQYGQRYGNGTTLFLEDEEEENAEREKNGEGRVTQEQIISQYVNGIELRNQGAGARGNTRVGRRGEGEDRKEQNGRAGRKKQRYVSQQILDLDGDFDEETSDYHIPTRTPPSKREAWETPVSPMDHLFRQTVGALGSTNQLPYIPDDDDDVAVAHQMNDSSSSNERTPADYVYDQEVNRGGESEGESDSTEETRRESEQSHTDEASDVPDASLRPQVDTEEGSYADEDYISISDLPFNFGSTDSTQLSHHELNGMYHTEPPLTAEDLESLEQQMDQLNNSHSSHLFSQPSIAEIIVGEADNLIVLPRGESPVSSPDPRLMGGNYKKRLATIGDEVGSSGGAAAQMEGSPKYTNHIPSTSSESENDSDGDQHDEEDSLNNITPRAQSTTLSLPSEDTEEFRNNQQNWGYAVSNSHIPPSPFIDDGFKNQIPFPQSMNGLSPSSRPLDFQSISEVADDDLLAVGHFDDDEVSSSEGGKGEEGEREWSDDDGAIEEEIEPREMDKSFLVPSPQRPPGSYHPQLGDSSSEEAGEDSQDSESDEDSPPTQSDNLLSSSKTRMTSDDEREEDQRLFNAIMRSGKTKTTTEQKSVPRILSDDFPAPSEEELQEYFIELMRSAQSGSASFLLGPSLPSHSTLPLRLSPEDQSETKLQQISAHAIQNMDNRFRDLFSKHLSVTSTSSHSHPPVPPPSSLSSSVAEERIHEMQVKVTDYHSKKLKQQQRGKGSEKKRGEEAISFDPSGLAIDNETVLTPEEFHLTHSPSTAPYNQKEYQHRLREILHQPTVPATEAGVKTGSRSSRTSGGSGSGSLPVTQNEELNQMFTQSFRNLVSYYSQPNPPVVETDQTKKKNGVSVPGATTSTQKKAVTATVVEIDREEPRQQGKRSKTIQSSAAARRRDEERELDLGEGPESRHRPSESRHRPPSPPSASSSSPQAQAKNEKSSSTRLTKKRPKESDDTMRLKTASSVLYGHHHEEITPATDYSKHLHGNIPSVGRVVYGTHNEGPIMAQEWNTSNTSTNRSSRSRRPSSAPSSPLRRHASTTGQGQGRGQGQGQGQSQSNSRRSPSPKKKGVRWMGQETSESLTTETVSINRPSSARQRKRQPSSSSSAHSSSSLQRLTAPTFSSVVRSLNIAGLDPHEVQAITQASRDANYFLANQHSDLSQPSFIDSYYTSGVDVMTAMAAAAAGGGAGGGGGGSNGKKKKKQR